MGVIDISRNLLLIMSNWQHVTQNNEVNCLLNDKYLSGCSQGRIYILSRINGLRNILSKLFIVSVLGTRLHSGEEIFFSLVLGTRGLLR